MVYNSQKRRGFNDIFGTLNRTFKPVIEGAVDVGTNLATGLVSDLLSGKSPKASVKEHGNRAKGLVAQRALQSLQGGSGNVSPSSLGWSDKTAKRKRSRSKSKPRAKRKQTGGIYPPIHYPLGNYPDYDRVMEGRGLISKMRSRLRKDAIADCKDWLKRQQKGGRKKRKPKKQTGAGKKRKPRKQTGPGKKRKPRKQTGDGLWSGIKEIFQ